MPSDLKRCLDIALFKPGKDGPAGPATAYIIPSVPWGGKKEYSFDDVEDAFTNECLSYEQVESAIKELEKDLQAIRKKAKRFYDEYKKEMLARRVGSAE